MIRGMICRNSNVAATICLIAWLAGFPSWRTELSARNAPEVFIGNKSTPELTVRVYKFPGLSDWVLNGAYAEAARILRPVPIKLKWVDCTSSVSASCTSPLLPTDLIIRVLANALPQATESALGLASSGESAAAFIFYDRVVAQRTHTRLLPTILGRAMAHEITHLLVPQQDHSDLGLMRREWSADDLGFANSACLGLPIRSIQFMQKEALRRVVSAQSSTLR